jgi:hypothetical protein
MLEVNVRTSLPAKPRPGPRLVLQPASRRSARHASTNALKRFFLIADSWELSPLQQCRLLRIPSPQVLTRYRLGQAPRLSATQQERAALIASVQHSLLAESGDPERAWAWVHAPQQGAPFDGDSPLYYMLERGLYGMREVARLLVRESEPR